VVTKMASERPVVIFSKSSCCMCHSIKTLFSDFGVNPAVYELDEMQRAREIEQALSRLGCNPTVPAVFIGGEFVGGANEVMNLHLQRSLIPMLKRAGALWSIALSSSELGSLLGTMLFGLVGLMSSSSS
ncbi:Thioredoxin superfamily protein, partial [Prunus dulcis]